MTEITSTISPSTPSAPSAPSTGTNTNNNVTTTTIIPPSIPSDNINNSEYQRSYSWKLPMVTINRPKERTKTEYQREFTWKNDHSSTPSPSPSPAPIPPSPIPQDTFTDSEPIRPATTIVNNSVDYVGSKLNELSITNNNNSSSSINEVKYNSNFVSDPDDSILEKFNSNNNAAGTWKDGLRNKNSSESKLASSLDPRTKKIVALEANRLSKKSRSYSMYSLHDQLKVSETANDLSSPFDTEYKSEFVNWKEYGTTVREDTKRRQPTSDHTLKRRGSWSAPAANTLPAPLKWLEDMNIDLGSRAYTREKLQPTITDSKSIRGITTTITAKTPSRSARDYNYYDEKRPTTSAEVRDYRYERPTTSADIRDYSRPMTSFRDYRYDDDDDNYHNTRRNFEFTHSKKDRNPSPLRSSTTLGHYNKDYYKDTPDVSNQYYDNREHSINNINCIRKDYDYKYDDRKYDDKKYDDRKYVDKKYDDRKYDDKKYDDRKYDDRKYDERKHEDRKRDSIYDDRRSENGYNGYEDRKRDSLYDDRRRENGYDDRQRNISTYDHDYRRRDIEYDDYDYKYNNRPVQTSDQEHYNNLGHSRNPSYASSNKGSVHDEPTNFSGPPLSYLDAVRNRSSVSSLSSGSTPSSPATPTGYDMNDFRWKRNNGLDPRIYKEQHYTPSVVSKSSSSSHNKHWQFEDERDKNYHPSVLSPSRNKFYIDEDDDESVDGYSSKRQSHDYKPLNSSSMRHSLQYSPSQTRSTSPSRESYGSSRKYYQKSSNHSNYSSRPPSRATSVSSHATSIEEESAILRDILKEAEIMTMKNLSEQKNNIFKQVDLTGIGVKNSGRATPSTKNTKNSSLVGQKKSTTTTTTKTATTKTTKTTKPGVRTSKTVPPAKSSSKTGAATTTKGLLPNNKKIHRPSSSLSSISSTSSYREAYQPPPTNFSAAREALSRARMKVEEMLEIVSNGGSLD